MSRLRSYYYLTKPGIVYGNALTAIAGYLFASGLGGNWVTFVSMLVGVMGIMAAACVFNNVIDRDIDSEMSRTKARALVIGDIRASHALFFASTLLVVGTLLLAYGTNWITLSVALFGFVAYVGLYTYAKRVTAHSTLIGTLSGATPPVIGYTAVTGSLDTSALLLLLLLVTWQMPHFYAISIFRRSDYANAGIPVLSVVKGVEAARQQIIAYAAIFVVTCISLGIFGGLSLLATLVVTLAASYWLYLCLQPVSGNFEYWARRLFYCSLFILLILSASLSLDGILRSVAY